MYIVLNLLGCETIKKAHAMKKGKTVFFIAGLFRCMRGEHDTLPDLVEGFVFVEEVEAKGQRMPFVHMIRGDVAFQDVEQRCTADTEQDGLRDAGRFIRIVKTMANGLCEVVILRYVRCQKKQGRRIEKMGLEEQCLYVDTCAMNSDGEDDARVLKKKV